MPILNQGENRTRPAICYIEGVTLYWYEFDELNLDGIAIRLGKHAYQGTAKNIPLTKIMQLHFTSVLSISGLEIRAGHRSLTG